MNELYKETVDAGDCELAANIMAEFAVLSAYDSEMTNRNREIIFGSYVLAVAYTDFKNDYDFENRIFNSLVDAGGNKQSAAQIADIVTESNVMRYIFSLDFLDQDYPKFGLRVGKHKKWLEPQKFINSILKLGAN